MENKEEYILNNLHLSNSELGELTGLSRYQVKRILEKHSVKRSKEQLKQISERNGELQAGSNNPNYKDGITQNNYHYKKIQLERNPQKVEARNIVYRAIKKGLLKKEPCHICGNPDSQAHHKDHNKPLEVEWLCRIHHLEADRQLREMIKSYGPLFSQVI